jgi:hypothetical protein
MSSPTLDRARLVDLLRPWTGRAQVFGLEAEGRYPTPPCAGRMLDERWGAEAPVR